jgi:chemotaxis protein CheD
VDIVVNVSEARISCDPADTLCTFALGSCIGVTLYDDLRKVGGMLHFQLPSATENPGRATNNPAMFADTGIALVLDLMRKRGVEPRRLRINVVGGAAMWNDTKLFDIGRRNLAAIQTILRQRGLRIAAEDVGGDQPRTVRMDLSNGMVTVMSNGQETSL